MFVYVQMSGWPGPPADPNSLYQQFQLQPGVHTAAAAPVSGGAFQPAPAPPTQFSNAGFPMNAQPQPGSAPAAMDNAMQMLLARAMSIPLATVLFQSLMPQPQPQPTQTHSWLQMMQQALAPSAAVAQPPVVAPPPPAVAAQHLPTPAASPSTSSSIQLPPMEPTVAKEMLVQLVQQLQQAGQLQNDDTVQRLLQQSTNAAEVTVVKKEADQSPLCVIAKTESCDDKPPQPEVYMDVAEDGNSASTSSTPCGDVGQDRRESYDDNNDDDDNDRNVSEPAVRQSDGETSVRQRKSRTLRSTKNRQSPRNTGTATTCRTTRLSTPGTAGSGTASRKVRSGTPPCTSSRTAHLGTPAGTGIPCTTAGTGNACTTAGTGNACTTAGTGTQSLQRKVSETQQKASSVPVRRSSATETDVKLQKKCFVQMEKMPLSHTPTPASQSRIDRLKNMKKYNFSTDVLHTHTSPEPGPSPRPGPGPSPGPGSGLSATAGSSKDLVDQKPAGQQKTVMSLNQLMGINQPSPVPSTRAGTKNIFSIFAQHIVGQGEPQDEPAPEVRPSDPLPASLGVLLQRSINVAQNTILSLRSMYLGYASQNMEWLSLISGTFGGNRNAFCQCIFCPKLAEYPRDIAVHVSGDHQQLLFALNRLKPVVGPLMYIKCRHCNFVTVESTIAWIHFDIHHGIADILDCSDRASEMDMSGPDTPTRFIDIDDVMGSVTAYVCFNCSAINADSDTRASSMVMARHVARQHPDSMNFNNGNLVKLLMLTRAVTDPDSIKGSPTYRQAICNDQHARGRREVYICMFCR